MKTCSKCNKSKSAIEFYKCRSSKDGVRGSCKECANNDSKERRIKVSEDKEPTINGRIVLPCVEILKSIFEVRGKDLVRKSSAGNKSAGQVAGTLRKDGYRRVMVNGVLALAHRIVWKIETGEEPTEYLDHINGDRSDNRIENLRSATSSENMHNQEGRKSNRSGFSGVRWYDYPYTGKKPSWVAYIMVNSKAKTIGYYKELREALIAYEDTARSIHGEFAERKIAKNRQIAMAMGVDI